MKKMTKKDILYEMTQTDNFIKETQVAYEKDIVRRSFQFSLRIFKLYRELEKDSMGRIIGKQVLRSGTSIGANIHEAQAAQSRADFAAKMTIASKEARETEYWIKLIEESKLLPANRLVEIKGEIQQLVKIITSIVLTTKRNGHK
jgi:four helix bundle protein